MASKKLLAFGALLQLRIMVFQVKFCSGNHPIDKYTVVYLLVLDISAFCKNFGILTFSDVALNQSITFHALILHSCNIIVYKILTIYRVFSSCLPSHFLEHDCSFVLQTEFGYCVWVWAELSYDLFLFSYVLAFCAFLLELASIICECQEWN